MIEPGEGPKMRDVHLGLCVNTALNNALEGGYDSRPEDTDSLCRSLYDYDEDCQQAADMWSGDAAPHPWEILGQYVDAWKEANRATD